MRHRVREQYTVIIARTDKPPMTFSFQPIAVWATLLAVLGVMGLAVFFCLQKTNSPLRRSDMGRPEWSIGLHHQSNHPLSL